MSIFTRFQHRPALTAGIVLLLACCLVSIYSIARLSSQLWNPSQLGVDEAAQWAQRLVEIRSDLPSRGVVGYFSEPTGGVGGDLNQTLAFAWTQYDLAPLIIQKNTQLKLVIGDLPQGISAAQMKQLNLALIHDYGMGIYLFRGVTP
jgi:hypothetical protein